MKGMKKKSSKTTTRTHPNSDITNIANSRPNPKKKNKKNTRGGSPSSGMSMVSTSSSSLDEETTECNNGENEERAAPKEASSSSLSETNNSEQDDNGKITKSRTSSDAENLNPALLDDVLDDDNDSDEDSRTNVSVSSSSASPGATSRIFAPLLLYSKSTESGEVTTPPQPAHSPPINSPNQIGLHSNPPPKSLLNHQNRNLSMTALEPTDMEHVVHGRHFDFLAFDHGGELTTPTRRTITTNIIHKKTTLLRAKSDSSLDSALADHGTNFALGLLTNEQLTATNFNNKKNYANQDQVTNDIGHNVANTGQQHDYLPLQYQTPPRTNKNAHKNDQTNNTTKKSRPICPPTSDPMPTTSVPIAPIVIEGISLDRCINDTSSKNNADINQTVSSPVSEAAFSSPDVPSTGDSVTVATLLDDDDGTISSDFTAVKSNIKLAPVVSVDRHDLGGVNLGDCIISILGSPERRQRKHKRRHQHGRTRSRSKGGSVIKRGSTKQKQQQQQQQQQQTDRSAKNDIDSNGDDNGSPEHGTMVTTDAVIATVASMEEEIFLHKQQTWRSGSDPKTANNDVATAWGERAAHDAIWRMRRIQGGASATAPTQHQTASNMQTVKKTAEPDVVRRNTFAVNSRRRSSSPPLSRGIRRVGAQYQQQAQRVMIRASHGSEAWISKGKPRIGDQPVSVDDGAPWNDDAAIKTVERRVKRSSLPVDVDRSRVVNGARHAKSLQQTAIDHLRNNEFEFALELYEEILSSYREKYTRWKRLPAQSAEHRRLAELREYVGNAHHNIGIIYLYMGRYDVAVRSFRKAVETRKMTTDADSAMESEAMTMAHASSLSRLGIAYYATENHASALRILEEAATLCANLVEDDSSSQGTQGTIAEQQHRLHLSEIMNNLGCLHFDCGETTSAARALEAALRLQSDALSSSLYYESSMMISTTKCIMVKASTIRCNLGYVRLKLREGEAATRLFEESLLNQQTIMNHGDPMVLSTMDNLALANLQMGDKDKALKMYNRMLRIQTEVYGPHHVICAQTMSKIGVLHAENHDYDIALECIQRVNECQERNNDPNLVDRFQKLIGVGKLLKNRRILMNTKSSPDMNTTTTTNSAASPTVVVDGGTKDGKASC